MYGAPDSWLTRGPEEGCDWHDYYDDGACPECDASMDRAIENLVDYRKGS
jgi:hypothetical protein